MKIPNAVPTHRTVLLSLARIVSEDSQPVEHQQRLEHKSSKDS